MLPIFGLIVGLLIGYSVKFNINPEYSRYVAIAILASLDTVFGGITASIQKNFNMTVFITGFFANALLAAGLTYVGQKLDVDLGLAAIVVFGTRMFNNFAVIRRFVIEKYAKKYAKN